jgi:hypothetical protein
MKDNAHLYWPNVESDSRPLSVWSVQPKAPVAVVPVVRLDGGCLLYRLTRTRDDTLASGKV